MNCPALRVPAKPSDLEAFVTSLRRKQNKAIFFEAKTLPLVSSLLTSTLGLWGREVGLGRRRGLFRGEGLPPGPCEALSLAGTALVHGSPSSRT